MMTCSREHSRTALVVVLLTTAGWSVGCREDASPPGDQQASKGDRSSTASVHSPKDEALPLPPPEFRRRKPLQPELAPIFQLIERGETGRARLSLTSWMNTHPQDGQAMFLNGLTYHREKSYALARKHFDRAIETEPDYFATYYFNAWAAFYLGELDDAKRLFLADLAFQPTNGDSHFGLGLIALDRNELDDAQERFERAIELHTGVTRRVPELAKSRARLGEVFALKGELERARTELEAATTMNPTLYEAWYQLSRVLTRLGEDDAAAEAFRRHEQVRDQVNEVREAAGRPPVTNER